MRVGVCRVLPLRYNGLRTLQPTSRRRKVRLPETILEQIKLLRYGGGRFGADVIVIDDPYLSGDATSELAMLKFRS